VVAASGHDEAVAAGTNGRSRERPKGVRRVPLKRMVSRVRRRGDMYLRFILTGAGCRETPEYFIVRVDKLLIDHVRVGTTRT